LFVSELFQAINSITFPIAPPTISVDCVELVALSNIFTLLTYIFKVLKLTIVPIASVRRIRIVFNVSPVITMLLVVIISVSVFNDGELEEEDVVFTSCFPANIISRSKILEIDKKASFIIFYFEFT
jgi:non-ribosomal peptide synthetase component E (peptide arylation enzyme)